MKDHNAKYGTPKIGNKCSLPLTGKEVVNLIITNLGVFEVDKGIKVLETASGVTNQDIINSTEAKLVFS